MMIDRNYCDVFVYEAFENAKEKGWHDEDKERSSGEYHALIHSEVSEATEEVRKAMPAIYQWQEAREGNKKLVSIGSDGWDSSLKPEGEAIELVDVAIRIADYFGFKGYDLGISCLEFEDNQGHVEQNYFSIKGMSGLEFHNLIHCLIANATWTIYMREGVNENGRREELIRSERISLGGVFSKIAQYFISKGWDLESTIRLKLDYNKTRSYRHGGKAL